MITLTEQLPEPNNQVYHHSEKFINDSDAKPIDPAILAALIV